MIKNKITQEEFIKLLRDEEGDSFQPFASFLIMEPFWKGKSIGLRKDELISGVYLLPLSDKSDSEGQLTYNGYAYYIEAPVKSMEDLAEYYNKGNHKYQIPIEAFTTGTKKTEGVVIRPINILLPKKVTIKDLLETTSTTDSVVVNKPKEELPIVKQIFGVVCYRKGNSVLKISSNNVTEDLLIELFPNEEDEPSSASAIDYSLTKQEFLDLVDLFNEAKKDILK